MRVELIDPAGYCRSITSSDPELVGRWFAEHAPKVMSADCRLETRIRIWPENEQDHELLRHAGKGYPFTQDALLELAQVILDAAARQGELEHAASR